MLLAGTRAAGRVSPRLKMYTDILDRSLIGRAVGCVGGLAHEWLLGGLGHVSVTKGKSLRPGDHLARRNPDSVEACGRCGRVGAGTAPSSLDSVTGWCSRPHGHIRGVWSRSQVSDGGIGRGREREHLAEDWSLPLELPRHVRIIVLDPMVDNRLFAGWAGAMRRMRSPRRTRVAPSKRTKTHSRGSLLPRSGAKETSPAQASDQGQRRSSASMPRCVRSRISRIGSGSGHLRRSPAEHRRCWQPTGYPST